MEEAIIKMVILIKIETLIIIFFFKQKQEQILKKVEEYSDSGAVEILIKSKDYKIESDSFSILKMGFKNFFKVKRISYRNTKIAERDRRTCFINLR